MVILDPAVGCLRQTQQKAANNDAPTPYRSVHGPSRSESPSLYCSGAAKSRRIHWRQVVAARCENLTRAPKSSRTGDPSVRM